MNFLLSFFAFFALLSIAFCDDYEEPEVGSLVWHFGPITAEVATAGAEVVYDARDKIADILHQGRELLEAE